METFLKKAIDEKIDSDVKRYFLRFGKGSYNRRFLISFDRGNKLKIRGSFEMANDIVKFLKENNDVKFSGKVLSKDKIAGLDFKKKAGVFVYEVENSDLKEFENPYYYLVNVTSDDVVLKTSKSLPKPGQRAEKIDEKFCALDLDLKYWPKIKEVFFWDVPECKKCVIEHTVSITGVEIPKNETNPEKIRENAVRKGKIMRKMVCDGKEIVKEYDISI